MLNMIKILLFILLLISAREATAQIIFLEMEILSESSVSFEGNSAIRIYNNQSLNFSIDRNSEQAVSFYIDDQAKNYLVNLSPMKFENEAQQAIMNVNLMGDYFLNEPFQELRSFTDMSSEISLPSSWNGTEISSGVRFYIYGDFFFADNPTSTILAYSILRLEFY